MTEPKGYGYKVTATVTRGLAMYLFLVDETEARHVYEALKAYHLLQKLSPPTLQVRFDGWKDVD